MAHLCVPQNQALGVCRGFVPDIQVCGTHGRENLVNATITSNAEEELPSPLKQQHWNMFERRGESHMTKEDVKTFGRGDNFVKAAGTTWGPVKKDRIVLFVRWLLNVPATGYCISGTGLLRQFYVLPH